MVKPTLNPKQDVGGKDEIKKEKDIEAALKGSAVEAQVCDDPEISVDASQPRPRRCGFCCIMLIVLLFVFIAIGTFFAFVRTTRNNSFCGVIYEEYPDQNKDYLYQEPQEKWCYEDVDIDLYGDLETIDKPADEYSERLTIMHDYKVNLSAYHLLRSKTCYIKVIDPEVIANPQEFWDSFQDPGFLDRHYEILYETYTAVEPAISNLDSLGPNIATLCANVPTYWIEKLPPITFYDLWNIFMDVLMVDYDDGFSADRVERDVRSLDDSPSVSKIRTFGGKYVQDMKVLPPMVIDRLNKAEKLPEKYKKYAKGVQPSY